MVDDGRFDEDSTVEVRDHHLRAALGAVDTDEGKMFRTDRSDTWMNDATRLVNRVGSRLTSTLGLGSHWTRTSRKEVGTETNPQFWTSAWYAPVKNF